MFIPIIPDLFRPYIQGREAAIEANWRDMSKYNDIQQGQLNNLMGLETFAPSVQQAYNQADAGRLANLFNWQTFDPRAQQVYNQADAGYLGNLFDWNTLQPRMDMAYDLAAQSARGRQVGEAQQPGNLAAAQAMSAANLASAPLIADAQTQRALAENQLGYNQASTMNWLMSQPWFRQLMENQMLQRLMPQQQPGAMPGIPWGGVLEWGGAQ